MKSRLDRFFAKRAAVLLLLLAAAGAALPGHSRWPALGGLLAGATLGFARFRSSEWILPRLYGRGGGKAAAWCAAAYAGGLLVLFAAAACAYFLNGWLFRGFLAGILLLPLVIMINSVTEAFGITKNGFE